MRAESTTRPVTEMILERLPATLELMGASFALAALIDVGSLWLMARVGHRRIEAGGAEDIESGPRTEQRVDDRAVGVEDGEGVAQLVGVLLGEVHLEPGCLTDRLSGDVVGGRSDASRDDQRIGSLDGGGDGIGRGWFDVDAAGGKAVAAAARYIWKVPPPGESAASNISRSRSRQRICRPCHPPDVIQVLAR